MKSIKYFFFALLCIILTTLPVFGAERGLTTVVRQLDETLPVGTQYLLIIAISRYRHWVALENPVKNAIAIKESLMSRYYMDEVIELYDEAATKLNIIRQFTGLEAKLTPGDSLLILYAGHGYGAMDESVGYWIPVDGGRDNVARENWLSNNELLALIGGIKASHICLLADACYSGKLLARERAYTDKPPDPTDIPYYRKAYRLTSRQVITSGASEVVPDVSEFAVQLKQVLEKNNDAFLDPGMLFDQVKRGVNSTLPLFGTLKDTGHQEGAMFLLFLKDRRCSLIVHTAEKGALYLNHTLYRETIAGKWIIQNLDQGEYR